MLFKPNLIKRKLVQPTQVTYFKHVFVTHDKKWWQIKLCNAFVIHKDTQLVPLVEMKAF